MGSVYTSIYCLQSMGIGTSGMDIFKYGMCGSYTANSDNSGMGGDESSSSGGGGGGGGGVSGGVVAVVVVVVLLLVATALAVAAGLVGFALYRRKRLGQQLISHSVDNVGMFI